MNEEIIIDGINVAECEYMLNNKIKGKQHSPAKAMPYAKETSCICRKNIDTPYNFCKRNPNCHYKQLKRLEKENNQLVTKCSQLEKENGELKEEIRQLIYGKTLEKTYTLFGKPIKYWENLERALEEIRENVQDWLQNDWSCYLCRSNMDERLTDIKNTINKVLESEGK